MVRIKATDGTLVSGHRNDGDAWSMVGGSKRLILLTLQQRLEPGASWDDLYEPASPARFTSACFPNFPKQHRQLETKHTAHRPVAVTSGLNCGTFISDRIRLQRRSNGWRHQKGERFVGLDTFALTSYQTLLCEIKLFTMDSLLRPRPAKP